MSCKNANLYIFIFLFASILLKNTASYNGTTTKIKDFFKPKSLTNDLRQAYEHTDAKTPSKIQTSPQKVIKHLVFYYKSFVEQDSEMRTQPGQNRFMYREWEKTLTDFIKPEDYIIHQQYVPLPFAGVQFQYFSTKLDQLALDYKTLMGEDATDLCTMVFQAIGVYEQIMRAMANEMFLVSKILEKQFTDIYEITNTKEQYLDQLIKKFQEIVDRRLNLYNLAIKSNENEKELEYWIREMYAFDRDVYKKAENYWRDQKHARELMSPEDNKWWEKETGEQGFLKRFGAKLSSIKRSSMKLLGVSHEFKTFMKEFRKMFISKPELDPYRTISPDDGKKLIYHQIKQNSEEWPDSKFLTKDTFSMWRRKAVLDKVVHFDIEQQGPPEVVYDCSSNSKDGIASYFCEQLQKFHKSLPGKQNSTEKSFQFDNLDSFTIAEKIFDHYLIAIAHEVNKLLSENKFEPESNLNLSKNFNEHITNLSEKFPECSTININQGICLELNWLLQEFIELKKKQRVLIALANVLDQANEAYWYNRQEKLRGNDVNSQKTWIYWSKIRESEAKNSVNDTYFWWIENDDEQTQTKLLSRVWVKINQFLKKVKQKSFHWTFLTKLRSKVLNLMCLTNEKTRNRYLLVNRHESDHNNYYARIDKKILLI